LEIVAKNMPDFLEADVTEYREYLFAGFEGCTLEDVCLYM